LTWVIWDQEVKVGVRLEKVADSSLLPKRGGFASLPIIPYQYLPIRSLCCSSSTCWPCRKLPRFAGYSSDAFVGSDQRVVWKAPGLVGSRQCERVAGAGREEVGVNGARPCSLTVVGR